MGCRHNDASVLPFRAQQQGTIDNRIVTYGPRIGEILADDAIWLQLA